MSKTQTSAESTDTAQPRLRLPLATIEDVRRELARLYREGKSGRRDVADVSRLANVLQILGRMIESSDLEARIAALEEAQEAPKGAGGAGTWASH